jgi:hypothetical protein
MYTVNEQINRPLLYDLFKNKHFFIERPASTSVKTPKPLPRDDPLKTSPLKPLSKIKY